MKNKFWEIVKIVVGVILVSIAIKGFYPPVSAEAIGYDISSLLFLILGGYWIYAGMKNWKRIK